MNKEITPEPWSVLSQKNSKGQSILTTNCRTGSYRYIGYINDHTDADRIAACVNACAGISDPGQWVPMAKTHIEISDLQGKQNQRLKVENSNLRSLLDEAVTNLLASNVWAGSSSLFMANHNLIERIQSFIGQPENEQPPQQ